MDKANVKEILERWTIGTAGRSYMSGLEGRPVMARGEGSYLYDTDGNAYLDFGSGQMGAALGVCAAEVLSPDWAVAEPSFRLALGNSGSMSF